MFAESQALWWELAHPQKAEEGRSGDGEVEPLRHVWSLGIYT